MRFTIRDLLWLMVVVGLGVALYLDRIEIQKERVVLRQQVAAEKASLQKEHTVAHKQSLDLVRMLDSLDSRQFRMDREIEDRARILASKTAPETKASP